MPHVHTRMGRYAVVSSAAGGRRISYTVAPKFVDHRRVAVVKQEHPAPIGQIRVGRNKITHILREWRSVPVKDKDNLLDTVLCDANILMREEWLKEA